MNNAVYLDHNATTPVHPEVLKAMLPYFSEDFGNASSKTHVYGIAAENAVKHARSVIASHLTCADQEITFTSGSTEALNLGILGVFEAYISKGNEIVTVKTEHKAVLDTCAYLEKKGAKVTYLSVDKNGKVNLKELDQAITPRTILVCIMLANNETGVIQDMKQIAEIVHRKGSLLLSDTTQAWGKIPVDLHELGIDLACMSAHKCYGPKGVGMLFTRRKDPRVVLVPQIHGGGHENGKRSGTLNVPGIVGLGKAVERIPALLEEMKTIEALRNKLESDLAGGGKIEVNGVEVRRLPNTSNLRVKGVRSKDLIATLPMYAFSTGSACTTASQEPSHVLKAMGLSDEDVHSSIRISLGVNTTREDVEGFIKRILGY